MTKRSVYYKSENSRSDERKAEVGRRKTGSNIGKDRRNNHHRLRSQSRSRSRSRSRDRDHRHHHHHREVFERKPQKSPVQHHRHRHEVKYRREDRETK